MKKEHTPPAHPFIKFLYVQIEELNHCINLSQDANTQKYLNQLKDIYKLHIDNLATLLTKQILKDIEANKKKQ